MSFNEETRIFDTEWKPWEFDLSAVVPIDSRVLLERVDLSESSIILTDKPPIHRGRVLRIGPGKRREDGSRRPMDVQPGDVVWYQSCDMDNGTHILIEEADILLKERGA